MQPNIGIAILTRNRQESYELVKSKIEEYIPDNSILVVVDDASDSNYADPCFRFNERSGIPKGKNKCLQILMSHKVDHLFLFDDDCYPIVKDWHQPYISSQHDLLCYTWYSMIAHDYNHKHHIKGHGCMMYINKSIVNTIGGFDTAYGLGKYEHTAYFERAYNAGLIPHPFIDILGSNKLLHSMDEYKEIERSFSHEENTQLLLKNLHHYNSTRNNKSYIPYHG